MHDSVYEIAGGDPRKARLLRESLEKLAAGPDERLKEMARSVLNGETDLRQEAASDAYGDARDVDHCRDSAGRLGAETGRSKAWRSHSFDQGG